MTPDEVILLSDTSEIADRLQEWRLLAENVEGTSYFQTPDWVVAWWETIARRPLTQLALWRSGAGNLEAVVCLSRTKERVDPRIPFKVSVWTNAGAEPGAADHCGWPVLPSRARDARKWIVQRGSRGTIVLRNLDPEISRSELTQGGVLLRKTPCPRIHIETGNPHKIPSRRLRKDIRTGRKVLAQENVILQRVPPGHVDSEILDRLYDLHERQWRSRGKKTSFIRSDYPLHLKLVDRAAGRSGPAAVVAMAGDTTIGVLYGFWWRDTFSYYQLGWDLRWAPVHLGNVLVDEAIQMVIAEGGRVFDFLRGNEVFKYRFGAVDRTDETWTFPRGLFGHLVSLKAKFIRHFENKADRGSPRVT